MPTNFPTSACHSRSGDPFADRPFLIQSNVLGAGGRPTRALHNRIFEVPASGLEGKIYKLELQIDR